MPKQDFLRFAMMHPFRLLALVISGILITACGVTSQASPTAEFQPTAGPSTIVTEVAMEIPVLEMDSSLTLPPLTEKHQVIQGELALFCLKEIYKDNVTGWWVDAAHTQYKFLDASGKEAVADIQNVTYDAAEKVVTILDDARNPLYTRYFNKDGVGSWLGVTVDDLVTNFIREKNIDDRSVNWNGETHKWELSLPITNEQLELLGPYYTLENDTLIYDGPTGKFEINDGVLKFVGPHVRFNAIELGEGRDLKIKTVEGGELTFAPENLRVNPVKAVDWDGTPIDAVVTMEAPGWGPLNQFVLTPEWGMWTSTMDVASSLRMKPSPRGNNLTLEIIAAWAETEFAAMSEITIDDILSKRLFWNEILALRPLPSNYREPVLTYSLTSTHGNNWVLTQSLDQIEEIADVNPLRVDNNPIIPVGVYRFLDPSGVWKVRMSYQYPYQGGQVIIPSYFGKASADPTNVEFTRIGEVAVEPARMSAEPIVSVNAETDCFALADVWDQTDLCAIMTLNGPWPREFMRPEVQELMAQFDGIGIHGTQTATAPIGAEFPSLQAMITATYSFNGKHLKQYFEQSQP